MTNPLEPLRSRAEERIGDAVTITGELCKVVAVSPLTIDLPGNPGLLATGVPGVTYTALAAGADRFNAIAFSLGASRPFVLPLDI